MAGTVSVVAAVPVRAVDTASHGAVSTMLPIVRTPGTDGRIPAGASLKVHVPDAIGAKTVIGQVTVDRALGAGFIVAYPCAGGLPGGPDAPSRSDLNFNGTINPVASNRLIVEADANGDICLYTTRPTALIVDVNAVTFDTGFASFDNRRTDTRIPVPHSPPTLRTGETVRVSVAEAAGGRTVAGQLTVDRTRGAGFITAYPCSDGLPNRSDLNFNAAIDPVRSNRLVVQADSAGDICLYTSRPSDLIVDVNAVAGEGIESFPNQRTDTRGPLATSTPRLGAGEVLRVTVPQARGGNRTVIGQLTVDRTRDAGFVTAYPCSAGLSNRSDLNFNAAIDPVVSNRLIVEADADGDICLFTSAPADIIVDVNAVATTGILSFPNQRTDTRHPGSSTQVTWPGGDVPVWPDYEPKPPINGVAALTGRRASTEVSRRPIIAVKIDNFRAARPQWSLEHADAIIEYNVEGVTRFMALYHSDMPDVIGPVRSARTADLDLLAAMNRPIFAYSGANPGVTAWIDSAARSGLVTDQRGVRGTCFARTDTRPGPHNLLVDPNCSLERQRRAGAARPLWSIDPAWRSANSVERHSFEVAMDGVRSAWRWDGDSGRYLRSQAGAAHLTVSGAQLAADTVVVLAAAHLPSPVDARSPHPITIGTGSATVHRDGRATQVVWSRADQYSAFEFFDRASGDAVPLDIGTTFIQIIRA